jgi:hypothetical protein
VLQEPAIETFRTRLRGELLRPADAVRVADSVVLVR